MKVWAIFELYIIHNILAPIYIRYISNLVLPIQSSQFGYWKNYPKIHLVSCNGCHNSPKILPKPEFKALPRV